MKSMGIQPVALDVLTLSEHRWRRHNEAFEIVVEDEWVAPRRGWLRRLSPAGHHHGVQLGSRDAAEAAARLALIASLTEAGLKWLSDYWTVLRAENKMIQYAVAGRLGIPVPAAAVASDISSVDEEIGNPVVVKPLGPGDYLVDGQAFAVHSRVARRGDDSLAGLSLAPFIVQRRVDALRHLRGGYGALRHQAW
jgi:hypothetical protein